MVFKDVDASTIVVPVRGNITLQKQRVVVELLLEFVDKLIPGKSNGAGLNRRQFSQALVSYTEDGLIIRLSRRTPYPAGSGIRKIAEIRRNLGY